MKPNLDQLFRVPYENDKTGTLSGATSSISPFVGRMSNKPVTMKAIDVRFGKFYIKIGTYLYSK